ncbi:MAG: hypothetical protein JXA15_09010 [Spirochaetales bacterium]|nr:hypothetical protein [Spirochaetales bacterium]
MKRIVFTLAALLAATTIALVAQDADEVLEKARQEYLDATGGTAPDAGNEGDGSTTVIVIVEAPGTPEAPERYPAELDGGRWPLVFNWVPGVGVPMGSVDASLAFGGIGSLARSVEGIQASSVFSLSEGNVEGFQLSGVFNIAGGGLEGFQSAGVFNIAGAGVQGFQGAGVFNIAGGDVEGFQGAGVFNIADDIEGFQGAGVFNIADRIDGTQVAGVFNIAGQAEGFMIAPVNVADSLDGVALGLINLIGDGVNEVGFEYAPAAELYGMIWRNGTHSLFSLVRLSAPIENLPETWSEQLALSLGLGTRLSLGRASWIDLDLSGERVLDKAFRTGAVAALDSGDALALWRAFAPYPSLGLSAGARLGPLKAWIGARVDIDLPGLVVTDERWHDPEMPIWSGVFFGNEWTARPRLVLGMAF